jgi:membrane protease subunit HflK
VAVAPQIVQYRIKNPCNFLFKVSNVHQLLKDMSEAVMRLVVGDRSQRRYRNVLILAV